MTTIRMMHLDGSREVRFADEDGIWTSRRAREDGTLDVDDVTLEMLARSGHAFEPAEPTEEMAHG